MSTKLKVLALIGVGIVAVVSAIGAFAAPIYRAIPTTTTAEDAVRARLAQS